jgi:hypothetical protein
VQLADIDLVNHPGAALNFPVLSFNHTCPYFEVSTRLEIGGGYFYGYEYGEALSAEMKHERVLFTICNESALYLRDRG